MSGLLDHPWIGCFSLLMLICTELSVSEAALSFKHGVSLNYVFVLLNLDDSYVLFLYLIVIEQTQIPRTLTLTSPRFPP